LGLIVVIVFLVVISGRLNLKNRFLPFTTPTPTGTQAKATTPYQVQINQYQNQTALTPTTAQTKGGLPVVVTPSPAQPMPTAAVVTKGGQPLTTIPSTGPETAMFPFILSLMALGSYLKKRAN